MLPPAYPTRRSSDHDEAIARVEQIAPHDGGCDQGRHIGSEQRDAPQRTPCEPARIHEYRGEQRERDDEGRADRDEEQAVRRRLRSEEHTSEIQSLMRLS